MNLDELLKRISLLSADQVFKVREHLNVVEKDLEEKDEARQKEREVLVARTAFSSRRNESEIEYKSDVLKKALEKNPDVPAWLISAIVDADWDGNKRKAADLHQERIRLKRIKDEEKNA